MSMTQRRSTKRRKIDCTDETPVTSPIANLTSTSKEDGRLNRSGRSKIVQTQDVMQGIIVKPGAKTKSETYHATPQSPEVNASSMDECSQDQDEDQDEEHTIRVSGRQRRAPRRYSNEMIPPDTIVVGGSASKKSKPDISTTSSTRNAKVAKSTSLSSPSFQHLSKKSTTSPRLSSPASQHQTQETTPSRKSSNLVTQSSSKTKLGKKLHPIDPSMVKATVPGRLKKITKTIKLDGEFNEDLTEPRLNSNKNNELDEELSIERSKMTVYSPGLNVNLGLEDTTEGILNTNSVRHNLPIDIPVSVPVIKLLKSIVLKKLSGRRPIPLVGLDDEYMKVHQLLEQTVLAGEGNSMIIIGDRGTAKTVLVNKALSELEMTDRDSFHIVRLNGFIHTDDKLALREIWRQLGKEMEVEDESKSKNYADTLSTLLALLSHPSELSGTVSEQVAKSVLFIIDEFDLFTTHPRQTLLYNLFDICQTRKAPIAVLGLTTRIDIAESLEKRVKSRFSHRFVYMSLPRNLAAFLSICKTAVQLQSSELSFDERNHLATIDGTHKQSTVASNDEPLTSWNQSIETLFQTWSLQENLRRIYYTSKSIPVALTSFLLPILDIDSDAPHFYPESFNKENSLLPPDSKLHVLPSLPTLSMALLIAAARLDIILESGVCNFNMAYEEYSSLATKAKVQASTGKVSGIGKVWGKEVAKGAWEKLLDMELLIPVTSVSSSTDMVRCDVALEEIEGSVPGLEKGMAKWCREI